MLQSTLSYKKLYNMISLKLKIISFFLKKFNGYTENQNVGCKGMAGGLSRSPVTIGLGFNFWMGNRFDSSPVKLWFQSSLAGGLSRSPVTIGLGFNFWMGNRFDSSPVKLWFQSSLSMIYVGAHSCLMVWGASARPLTFSLSAVLRKAGSWSWATLTSPAYMNSKIAVRCWNKNRLICFVKLKMHSKWLKLATWLLGLYARSFLMFSE